MGIRGSNEKRGRGEEQNEEQHVGKVEDSMELVGQSEEPWREEGHKAFLKQGWGRRTQPYSIWSCSNEHL